MNLRFYSIVLSIFVASTAFDAIDDNHCLADMLMVKGNEAPIFGLVVRDSTSSSNSNIEFLVFNNSQNKFTPKTFHQKEIQLLVETIDQNELSNLRLERLDEFRDLSEKLQGFENDPLAKFLARRLAFICVHHESRRHADSELLKSSLKNLVALAENESEKKQFEMLAHIYGGIPIAASPANHVEKSPSEDDVLLKLIQLVRKGNSEASEIPPLLKKLNANKTLNGNDKNLVASIELAIKKRQVSPAVRLKLIKREYEIRFGEQATPGDSNQFLIQEHSRNSSESFVETDISLIAGFDLEAIRFKNGKWIRPDENKIQK